MMGLGLGRLGAIPRAISSAFSPAVLWPLGASSPGMWIDPAYVAASFQDSAGTTALSAIGTVADSANPVGLILDRKAGLELGPELVIGAPSVLDANWTDDGGGSYSADGGSGYLQWPSFSLNKTYFVSFRLVSRTSGSVVYAGTFTTSTPGTHTGYMTGQAAAAIYGNAFVGSIDNISAREIPGLHMLQATSPARPLASAKGGQAVAGDGTYDAAGYPVYQQHDGTDDGMETAAFSADTVLVNGMDGLIAIRRDSTANAVCGLYESVAEANKVFGIAESASGSGCVGSGAGTPTVWVDSVQLTGGTAVTRGTLHTALTAGDWHILEFRNLDLSTWTAAGFGLYTSYVLNGGRGPIMLFESGQDANRDLARAQMAAYFGVTLP